jgi:curved DNA-binding protein
MTWQPPPSFKYQDPSNKPQSDVGTGASTVQEAAQDLDYYQLLQVNRDAHATIIRYSYRFLAAMYHPDNAETGNADKFRIISEAWRTLSDDGKRAAYDLSLGIKDKQKAEQVKSQTAVPQFGRDSLPHTPKTNLTWNEIELRLAILQILLEARRSRPQTGGASGKMIMDCLNIDDVSLVEFAIWYLREKGYIESGERVYMITVEGLDYLTEQLSQTQILGGGNPVEEKTSALMAAANKAGQTAAPHH